jgi:hypothetical protein
VVLDVIALDTLGHVRGVEEPQIAPSGRYHDLIERGALGGLLGLGRGWLLGRLTAAVGFAGNAGAGENGR